MEKIYFPLEENLIIDATKGRRTYWKPSLAVISQDLSSMSAPLVVKRCFCHRNTDPTLWRPVENEFCYDVVASAYSCFGTKVDMATVEKQTALTRVFSYKGGIF